MNNQADYREIVADLTIQERDKSTTMTVYRDVLSAATEPWVLCTTTKYIGHVSAAHSVWKYHTPGCEADAYNGIFIRVMGNHATTVDPDATKIKVSLPKWKKMTLT